MNHHPRFLLVLVASKVTRFTKKIKSILVTMTGKLGNFLRALSHCGEGWETSFGNTKKHTLSTLRHVGDACCRARSMSPNMLLLLLQRDSALNICFLVLPAQVTQLFPQYYSVFNISSGVSPCKTTSEGNTVRAPFTAGT